MKIYLLNFVALPLFRQPWGGDVAGCGFCSASVNFITASLDSYAAVVFGMLNRWGENSTVRAILSALVFVT